MRPDCSPVRTAIGTYNGTLKDTPAVELGATTIKACLERAGVAGQDVGTVVMGNVIQAGHRHRRDPAWIDGLGSKKFPVPEHREFHR